MAARLLKPVVAAPENFGVSKPLRQIAAERSAQTGPILTHKVFEVPNRPTPKDEEENVRNESKSATHGPDGALQTSSPMEAMPGPSANFDGVSSADNAVAFGGRVSPPDTNGAVGPNHYVQTVNLLVGIYDKAGNLLVPKFKMSSLFASLGAPCGTQDDGDPIVLYDRLADRWLISQFVLPNYPSGPFYQEIAISQTGDPTGAYYIYCFMVHATEMNDYPHFGIWTDGYYMTAHQFTAAGAWAGQGVWCFDRTKMLAGDPTASFIYFDLNTLDPAIGGMLPADADGFIPPPAGAPDVFAYPLATEWGDAVDGMRLFNFHVDWAAPAASTFTERAESPVATAAYDPSNPSGRRDITQPSPATSTMKLDSIADRYMHRLQYRNFGGSESLIVCQSVDALVWPNYQSAVHYCQLKNAAPGGAFSPAEQATFAPDGDNRWMGSAACDWQGNLAVGYSVSSLTTFPSVRYAGRLATDPANQLTQGETTLIAGSGVQRSTTNRWGDYSALTLDPTDDATFWYTQEYYTAASQATSTVGWLTRVGSFKFAGVPPSPRGTLTVHVTNCITGLPVPNAAINITGGYFRTTDASGNAVLTMAPGSYTVTASKTTYQAPASAAGVVTNGGSATVNLCLQPTVPLLAVGPATLVTESCVPPNGVIDPNEQVTVSFCVNNIGSAATSNLTGTLQATGGVVNPSGPATYGVVVGEGGQGCANVTFAASYLLSCGGTLTATIHFQDGALDLGSLSYSFTLGTLATVPLENFDGVTAPALPAGWTATRPTGTVALWATSTAQANTAPNSVFTTDPTTVNDNRLDSPAMAIPSAPSKLNFRNYYNLESGYDGGVLEISIAGGAFTDILAAGGTFAAGGYNGTISSSYSNPIGGRQAWTGNAGAWILTTVNLPAAAQGQSVVFRFRMGSDTTGTASGWYVDTLTLSAPSCCVCPPITIAPTILAVPVLGQAYSQTLLASGTSGPFTYAVTSGALPTGLSLDGNTGAITGTPTAGGTFSFTITATDAAGCTGSQAYTVTPGCPAVTLSPASLPPGVAGTPFSQTIAPSGGTAPYTFAVTAGALPVWLTLNTSTGALTGTPTGSGSFPFTITATDTNGCTGSNAYTLSVGCPTITLAPTTLPAGIVGTAYSQTVTASESIPTLKHEATTTFTFSVTAGTLPPGLHLSATGVLSGTPTAGGTFQFTVTAADANACTASIAYTVTVGLYDTSFSDDNGRSRICANGKTGDWQYTVLSGAGKGVYTGKGSVTKTTDRWTFRSVAGSPRLMLLTYYPQMFMANGSLGGNDFVSQLSDRNTKDDPFICSAK